MKILIGVDYLSRQHKTGLDRYFDEMFVQFATNAVEFNVFCYDGSPQADSVLTHSSYHGKICSLDISRKAHYLQQLLNSPGMFNNLERVAKREKYDIAHLFIPMPVKKGVFNSPLITTIHDLTPFITPEAFPRHTPKLMRLTIERLINIGSYFITNSNTTTKDLLNYFPKLKQDRVFTVYLGLSEKFAVPKLFNDVKSRYGLPEDYFLYIGAMNKRKNLERVIDAFKIFKKANPGEFKLVLAGRMDWGGRSTEEYVKSRGLEKEVVFPGFIASEDLNTVINQSKALLYLSLYEGFGFPVLEGMACGTAVIASNVSSIPEISGDIPYMADPYSIDSIAQKMQEVVSDTYTRNSQIAKGLEWVKNFSWHATMTATQQAYNNVLQYSRI